MFRTESQGRCIAAVRLSVMNLIEDARREAADRGGQISQQTYWVAATSVRTKTGEGVSRLWDLQDGVCQDTDVEEEMQDELISAHLELCTLITVVSRLLTWMTFLARNASKM